MEFIGYAVKRTDTGLYWNKHEGWCNYPTIYPQKRFASCAGKYHTNRINYDFLKTVKIKSVIVETEEV